MFDDLFSSILGDGEELPLMHRLERADGIFYLIGEYMAVRFTVDGTIVSITLCPVHNRAIFVPPADPAVLRLN